MLLLLAVLVKEQKYMQGTAQNRNEMKNLRKNVCSVLWAAVVVAVVVVVVVAIVCVLCLLHFCLLTLTLNHLLALKPSWMRAEREKNTTHTSHIRYGAGVYTLCPSSGQYENRIGVRESESLSYEAAMATQADAEPYNTQFFFVFFIRSFASFHSFGSIRLHRLVYEWQERSKATTDMLKDRRAIQTAHACNSTHTHTHTYSAWAFPCSLFPSNSRSPFHSIAHSQQPHSPNTKTIPKTVVYNQNSE